MNAIRQICYGNVSADCIKMPKKWHKLRLKLIKVDAQLDKMLSKSQKELLSKSREIQSEMQLCERDKTFEYAFSVGVSVGYDSKFD
ncbi:MAG: hypothetical protein R3Y45_09245 [Bacillota bacterium]